jgi:glycosyltransferase involved in cell wall biosynthesis
MDTLNSVFNQDISPLEVICIDDGSTDGTLKILESVIVPQGIEYKIISGSNKGEYVQFLDADDLIVPNKLSEQTNDLPVEIEMIVSDYTKMDSSMRMINSTSDFSAIETDPLLFAIRDVISSLNPVYRRTLIERVGGYDESLPCSQDWEFNLRMILSDVRLKYVSGNLAVIRQVKGSVSSNFGKIAIQCSRILIQMEKKLKLKNLTEQHKMHVAKWFYEGAIYATKNESGLFLAKAAEWAPQFQFLSKRKNLLRKMIGKKLMLRIDKHRIVK